MKSITTKDFDRLLADIIDNDVFFLLSIPGVHRILSEHYSDDVLAAWDTEHRVEDEAPRSMNDCCTSAKVRNREASAL